jgi:signal transduction histidine kinase
VRNGILDPSAPEHEGRGLTGMRERIAGVDGRLIVQRVGDTFTITAWIPAR